MRLSRTVSLENGGKRDVVVHELRVREVRELLELIPDGAGGIPQADIPLLLRKHLPHILTMANESVTMPNGETVDDLSMSELMVVGNAWIEIHRPFLAALGDAQAAAGAATESAT